jgi:hypothetical protein
VYNPFASGVVTVTEGMFGGSKLTVTEKPGALGIALPKASCGATLMVCVVPAGVGMPVVPLPVGTLPSAEGAPFVVSREKPLPGKTWPLSCAVTVTGMFAVSTTTCAK